jgi:hypothetical protein
MDYGLLAVKAELGGPVALSSWVASTDPCTWSLVDCAGGSTPVGLDLSYQSLSVALPDSLKFVTSLTAVTFQGNAMSGGWVEWRA